jgi:UDP-glucose 4-epimerase
VLDNGTTGSAKRIADILREVEWIDGDIRDTDCMSRACRDVNVVFHFAAIASVPECVADPITSNEVNVTGTLNVLRAAQHAGVQRVVFASSSALYGDSFATPKIESLPTMPVSPYGVQKLAAESYCRIWTHLYNVETVALRYFNVFGPSQNPRSEYAAVIPRFIQSALAGEPPIVYGDGEQTRDFVYVRNVVECNLLAASSPHVAGMTINVGSGIPTSLNQVLADLGDILGRRILPIYQPARIGDIRESLASITLLRTALGYEPSTLFHEGLQETVEAFRVGSRSDNSRD